MRNRKILIFLILIFLTSCKFEYIIIVNDDNTVTLIQKMIFSKEESKKVLGVMPEIPMNIAGKREYLELKGIKINSWPTIDTNAPIDTFIFEIEQHFPSIDSMIYLTNSFLKEEKYSVLDISNYFTHLTSIESNFFFFPKVKDLAHPIYQTGLYESDIDLILKYNKPIDYTNGKLLSDHKTVMWSFKMKDGKFIKIGFIKQNKTLDFVIQLLSFFLIYNIIILVIILNKKK